MENATKISFSKIAYSKNFSNETFLANIINFLYIAINQKYTVANDIQVFLQSWFFSFFKKYIITIWNNKKDFSFSYNIRLVGLENRVHVQSIFYIGTHIHIYNVEMLYLCIAKNCFVVCLIRPFSSLSSINNYYHHSTFLSFFFLLYFKNQKQSYYRKQGRNYLYINILYILPNYII